MDSFTRETIEVKVKNEWIPILGSQHGLSTLNFWTEGKRFSKKTVFERRKKKKYYFLAEDKDVSLNIDYCLEENNILHIKYNLKSNRNLQLSKLGVFYKILLENDPDFTWVPHVRPKINLLIGDHVFRSPVIVLKKKKISFAFIPDLKTLSKNRPFPAFLDFSLKGEESPYISYGFGIYKPYRHVYFKYQPKEGLIINSGKDLTFRFYIIAFEKKTVEEILYFINDFFWQKYLRRGVYENLEPQILPYDVNVRESLDAIFLRHKYWGDLKINNVDCGGFWGPSWIGVKKGPLKFINQQDLKEYLETYSKRHRIAVIFNTAWFLNIRSAYGILFFGKYWNDKSLLEKAGKMLNLVLELPRIRGIFPSLVLPESENAVNYSVSKGVKAWWHIDYYNIVDTSLAMYWAIKLSLDFKINQTSIIKKSQELVELLKSIQLENGAIPTFINFSSENEPEIIDDLLDSASSGAPLMFLLEYCRITNDRNIIPTCEKIANYIIDEIIPSNKWHDFEAFYSCTFTSKTEYDHFTESHIMNNLSIYWCAEGFLALYRITKKKEYIDAGERTLAILSLFQQVWNMPYISYNTFGGFGCQNNDAELGDSRQALFVKTYMEYYLETGKEEYMERAIAALRASWALQLLSEYKDVSPGNLKGRSTIDTIDRGCMSENYGHSGRDERIHNFVLFDWGNGTATTATAYAKKHFGDLFIDFKNEFVFGIDGILIKKFNFVDNQVQIELHFITGKKNLTIKAREIPFETIDIEINQKSFGIFNKAELEIGIIKNI
jgi:hypothetical protein